jgi:hypothetical protein
VVLEDFDGVSDGFACADPAALCCLEIADSRNGVDDEQHGADQQDDTERLAQLLGWFGVSCHACLSHWRDIGSPTCGSACFSDVKHTVSAAKPSNGRFPRAMHVKPALKYQNSVHEDGEKNKIPGRKETKNPRVH